MKKCLIWTRVSTERQEIESQIKETTEYAISLGFDEFASISRVGASAYKANQLYLEMIDELKEMIERDKDIKAVVCWHLNRLARNDQYAIEIKNFLIEHKVNLYIKEPQLKLLNDDGTVNEGAEVVFNIFAAMSRQQITELRAKSHRAKVRDKALHKYIGAKVPFGYKVEDGFVAIDETNAKIVNELFNLYATGEWSYNTIAREFNERQGTNYFDKHNIKSMLYNTHYYDNEMCPPIITKEQYEKAATRRDGCISRPQGNRNIRFAAKLLVCPVCGKHFTANVRDYRCINDCDHKRMSISNLDGLLWLIASHLEGDRMLKTDTKDELRQKRAVLDAKIKSVDTSLARGNKRAQRGKKMALEGLIEIDEYKDILKQVEDEQKNTIKKIEGWKAEITKIDRLIEEDTMTLKRIVDLSNNISEMDEAQMFEIVHRWIKRITFTDDWVFSIETHTRVYTARYDRYGFPSRWFTTFGHALAVPKFQHNKNGDSALVPSKCGVNDIPITLAFLKGSEIV
jgi:DNA invertase Pin-like site-specific DNA recombinase